jgi:hypothetical protein
MPCHMAFNASPLKNTTSSLDSGRTGTRVLLPLLSHLQSGGDKYQCPCTRVVPYTNSRLIPKTEAGWARSNSFNLKRLRRPSGRLYFWSYRSSNGFACDGEDKSFDESAITWQPRRHGKGGIKPATMQHDLNSPSQGEYPDAVPRQGPASMFGRRILIHKLGLKSGGSATLSIIPHVPVAHRSGTRNQPLGTSSAHGALRGGNVAVV